MHNSNLIELFISHTIPILMTVMFYLLIQGIVNLAYDKTESSKPLLTSSAKNEVLLFMLFVLFQMLDFLHCCITCLP
jgi:hypothetical protein